MKRFKKWQVLDIVIVMLCLVVLSCRSVNGGQNAELAETQPSIKVSVTPDIDQSGSPCGDGVCDEKEESDPDLCPQDCASTEVPPTGSPVGPGDNIGEKPCGDGVCDDTEKSDPDLCPQDCASTEVTPTEGPVDPGDNLGEKPCGDGVCDNTEKSNPDLCPQDCAKVEGRGEIPITAQPDYEPPINVFLVLHIDPLGELGAETFKPEPGMYNRTRNEIDWLMTEAARHNLHFTSLYNGWYPQMALEMQDLSQFEVLLAAGHEIGSHSHQITYDPNTDLWVSHLDKLSVFGRPNYDPTIAHQAWEDASHYVEAVLETIGTNGQNQVMCSTALSLSDERNLMTDFDFTIAAGNRLEVGSKYIGHMIWNPWRAANSDKPGEEIAENLSAPYLSLNHGAQIGGSEAHDTDVTVPQLQRQFLMLYTEWLARERTGAEDRVWSFGFVYHPNQGDRYNNDLVEFLNWLDFHFIGKQSPYNHTIANYAKVNEIAEEFYAWEAAHPGTSSFHYVSGDPYPYTYQFIQTKLDGAEYEAHVDLGDGVNGFRFSKSGQPIYLLWSDTGEKMVDFSTEYSGQVLVTNTAGETFTQDSSSIMLIEEPMMVELKR